MIEVFEKFSPANYLEQIRKTAYQLWETAGHQHGSALDFWLAAENKVMEPLAASGPVTAAEDASPPERPKRNPKQRQRQPLEK